MSECTNMSEEIQNLKSFLIPNSAGKNHQARMPSPHTEHQKELSTFLILCVYGFVCLAREDRNIPGIWWKGWRRLSIRFPFTLWHPGLFGCAKDQQQFSDSLKTGWKVSSQPECFFAKLSPISTPNEIRETMACGLILILFHWLLFLL